MDLSIVIVNWNTKDLLRNCLRSIGNDGKDLRVQTIVVDNNSRDGSREIVAREFPQVELVNSGGNLGFARANNLVLDRVQASLVLFLNPDTEVHEGALLRMVNEMRRDPSIGALSCKTRDASGKIQELGVQRFPTPLTEFMKNLVLSNRTRKFVARWLPHHDPERSGYVNKLFGACLLIRKEVLERVGSFDERFFMYCEDVDLCRRIEMGGWKLYYLGSTEILHLCGSSSSRVPGAFSVLMMCESFSKLMRKYYGWRGSVAYRLFMFAGAQVRLLVLLLLGLASMAGLANGKSRVAPLMRKYLTITQWALGARRPVVAE